MDPTTWDAPFPLIVAALFVIVMARTNATYWVGRLAANGAQHTRVSRWMDSDGYRRAVDRINRWGAPAVSISFLTIGVQTLVNLAAGATKMPLIRYIPATVVGSIAWALIYGTIGFVGLEAIALLWQHSPVAAIIVGVLLVGALGWFIARQLRRVEPTRVDQGPGASPTS